MAAITARLAELVPSDSDEGEQDTSGGRGKRYEPIPAPRWWQLEGDDRVQAIARLRAWVEQIYVPGYGHLAAALPPCWCQHVLCLYLLDWLSELWSVLYIASGRSASTLAGQAEWQTRYLPATVDQILAETADCAHSPRSRTGAANGSSAPTGATNLL